MNEDDGGAEAGDEHGPLQCSFCGKGQREVAKLIAGPKDYICDQCASTCVRLVKEKLGAREPKPEEAAAEPVSPPEPPSEEVLRRREIAAGAFRLARLCWGEEDLPKIMGHVAYGIGDALDPDGYERRYPST